MIAKIIEKDETRKDWAAGRIRLLLDLIPKHPKFPLSKKVLNRFQFPDIEYREINNYN